MDADDELARRRETERGELARQIFDNPLWEEAHGRLVNEQMAAMLAPAVEDEAVLEAKRKILALHSVKKALERVMQTGQMAQQQLDEEADKDGRASSQR